MHTVQDFLFDAVFETIDNYIFIFFCGSWKQNTMKE